MMEKKDGISTFYADSQLAWRQWLQVHHQQEKSVWLIIYHKASDTPSVYYDEAVDEALCFGWIDSKPNKRDAESYYQFFSKRNPKSNWSKLNKEKVERLVAEGRVMAAGHEMIKVAKATGTWDALHEVDALIIPDDLQAAFDENPQAFEHYQNFPPSSQRGILEWIFNAKRPGTRARRIQKTVEEAAVNRRANHYRQ